MLTVAVTNLTPNITPALNMVLVAYIRVDMLRLAPRRLQCASGYVIDPTRCVGVWSTIGLSFFLQKPTALFIRSLPSLNRSSNCKLARCFYTSFLRDFYVCFIGAHINPQSKLASQGVAKHCQIHRIDIPWEHTTGLPNSRVDP